MNPPQSEQGLRTIRVLVIDDSARARASLVSSLQAIPGVRVVGVCENGEEGLKRALELKPDAVTLDLEMPRMDGFTFLRVLLARTPLPVIVVSSYARKDNVFRALELGALDFITKESSSESGGLDVQLRSKIELIRSLRPSQALGPVPRPVESAGVREATFDVAQPWPHQRSPGEAKEKQPRRIVVIGTSTGGPPALQHIMGALPANLDAAILIAQHMPARFTAAFAARLNRQCALEIREAASQDVLRAGLVLLAPGGKQMDLERAPSGALRVCIRASTDQEVYVPSVDTLFESVAAHAGATALGIILTGMGRDGSTGVVSLGKAGGLILAESEESAIVHGMPNEAIATGHVDRILPLDKMASSLIFFAGNGRLP